MTTARPAVLQGRYATLATALEPSTRRRPPYLPGYQHRGEPLLISEFGEMVLEGSGGWGYGKPASIEEFVDRYRELVVALMAEGPVEGFCYTQLTDIEQERNGLLTFDRRANVDPAVLLPLTQTTKRR